ncbi:hypothetical protein HK104_006862, partial [Borealophlyctis nickersoniae]
MTAGVDEAKRTGKVQTNDEASAGRGNEGGKTKGEKDTDGRGGDDDDENNNNGGNTRTRRNKATMSIQLSRKGFARVLGEMGESYDEFCKFCEILGRSAIDSDFTTADLFANDLKARQELASNRIVPISQSRGSSVTSVLRFYEAISKLEDQLSDAIPSYRLNRPKDRTYALEQFLLHGNKPSTPKETTRSSTVNKSSPSMPIPQHLYQQYIDLYAKFFGAAAAAPLTKSIAAGNLTPFMRWRLDHRIKTEKPLDVNVYEDTIIGCLEALYAGPFSSFVGAVVGSRGRNFGPVNPGNGFAPRLGVPYVERGRGEARPVIGPRTSSQVKVRATKAVHAHDLKAKEIIEQARRSERDQEQLSLLQANMSRYAERSAQQQQQQQQQHQAERERDRSLGRQRGKSPIPRRPLTPHQPLYVQTHHLDHAPPPLPYQSPYDRPKSPYHPSQSPHERPKSPYYPSQSPHERPKSPFPLHHQRQMSQQQQQHQQQQHHYQHQQQYQPHHHQQQHTHQPQPLRIVRYPHQASKFDLIDTFYSDDPCSPPTTPSFFSTPTFTRRRNQTPAPIQIPLSKSPTMMSVSTSPYPQPGQG